MFLPFVILPLLVPQSYYHLNNERQEEESQKPVVVTFFDICHPPDTDQRDEDEKSSGDDRAKEAEKAHDAEWLQCSSGLTQLLTAAPTQTGIKQAFSNKVPKVCGSASFLFLP